MNLKIKNLKDCKMIAHKIKDLSASSAYNIRMRFYSLKTPKKPLIYIESFRYNCYLCDR